jgi:N-methylhydantoinase A
MMRAIRAVSVERGRDPRQFAMLAFGGNGPLFAAGIAAELGIGSVIIPPLPGVFSAFGMLVADTEHHARRSLRVHLDHADPTPINAILIALRDTGAERLTKDGFPTNRQEFQCAAAARYLGQSSELEVALPNTDVTPATIAALFGDEHERTYGFRAPPQETVELIGLSVMARGLPERPRLPERIPPFAQPVPTTRRTWFADTGWIETRVTDRAGLTGTVAGPLIIQEYDATCLVPAGMTARVDGFGNIRLQAATG